MIKFILFFVILSHFSSVFGQNESFSTIFTVTAYCKCEKCCGKWTKYGKTADGSIPKQGITCAASRKIAFGTVLNIEGVGLRVVQDRLAVRYDNRIDIYFDSHKEALKFGNRKLKVKIVK